MPKVIVQATIGDYGKWRSVFDRNKPMRTAASGTNETVYRGADNPNMVVAILDVSDLAKARQAMAGPEVRAAMQEAGIVGAPSVHFVE